MATEFSEKLSLVLKACSMSRGQFAAAVGVDKSLISRWCSGAITPSAYNLARLTQVIADLRPGFTLLDWDEPIASLAASLGVKPPATDVAGFGIADLLSPTLFAEARAAGRLDGAGYEGIWRVTRPSSEVPGQFIHDHVMLHRTSDGMLGFILGVMDIRYSGWTLPLQNKLFAIATDETTGTFVFGIFNGVTRQRAEVVDGLILTCMRDASGTPIASKCLMNRIADLSGDAAADTAAFDAAIAAYPLSAADAIPEIIRTHLWADCGPDALAAGGDTILMMHLARSMSRGALYEERRG
jgi:transcriptional regulator with XRE-family HTH domain